MVSVDTPSIELEEDDDVLTIALNRPEKLNAVTGEMMDALHSLFTELDENPEKALLLTGRGDATCAGADMDVIGSDDFSTSESEYEHKQQEILHLLQTYPRPTVMACKGATVGAAFILAADCDFAVIGEETTFQYPETQMGMFSDRLPKLLTHLHGAQVAREVVLKGDAVSPERALELGLVTDIVPESEVDAEAKALAEQLAEYDETVVEMVKETVVFDFDPDEHVGYP